MKKIRLITLMLLIVSLTACKKEKETTDNPKPAKLTVHTTIDGSGPQAGTQVHLYIQGTYDKVKSTDAQGDVVFDDLDAGTYELECHATGYYASYEHNIQINEGDDKSISTTLTYSPTLFDH